MKRITYWIALIGILFIQAEIPASLRVEGKVTSAESGEPLIGATVQVKGTSNGALTDIDGKYVLENVPDSAILIFSFLGMERQEIEVKGRTKLDVALASSTVTLDEVVVVGYGSERQRSVSSSVQSVSPKALKAPKVRVKRNKPKKVKPQNKAPQPSPDVAKVRIRGTFTIKSGATAQPPAPPSASGEIPSVVGPLEDSEEEPLNREGYSKITENDYKDVKEAPLSTFSIDVDRASYANMRRYLESNQRPPKDAVRIEELVNYFHYDYQQPKDEHPFNIITEMAECPWNSEHQILQVALQGKQIDKKRAPASNLVFLLDVSGSMNSSNKLPLLISGMKLLVDELTEKDKVSIVVYAGSAGLVLPSTSGANKNIIKGALERLRAGGSTAGAAGIYQAYKEARKNYIPDGNNRVILATDGDFNVGASSDAELVRLIEEKRKEGVFLTVLGFGTGNYQDAKMESLADHGNGNYAYIDNILEAQKVLVTEMTSTLHAIAKDVKIQLEFNPNMVKSYRLIGYENRLLAKEDFNDDTKDAGELGAGHTVTALYEIVPAESQENLASAVDPLKYQRSGLTEKAYSSEWLTVKFRYKDPKGSKSKLIEKTYMGQPEKIKYASENLRWASAIAGFGMLLRDSQYKGSLDDEEVLQMAKSAKGEDEHGYRSEFITLVKKAGLMMP